MTRFLKVLFLYLVILLGFAGTASGASFQTPLENRVGGFEATFPVRAEVEDVFIPDVRRENTTYGYDPTTDVWFYVVQNPWTKFDPLGLETIKELEKMRDHEHEKHREAVAQMNPRKRARSSGTQHSRKAGEYTSRINKIKRQVGFHNTMVKVSAKISGVKKIHPDAWQSTDTFDDRKPSELDKFTMGQYELGKQVAAEVATVGAVKVATSLNKVNKAAQLVNQIDNSASLNSGDELIDVYRAFGDDARAQGFSWTNTDPSSVSDFRNAAGLPSGGASGANNSADFMVQGRARVADIIESRPALPLDGNSGGLPELLIDPQNVNITDFSVLNP